MKFLRREIPRLMVCEMSMFCEPWLMLTGPTELMFIDGKQTRWLDYLPSPAVSVRATPTFCAVAMLDGSVNVYSYTGRRYVMINC